MQKCELSCCVPPESMKGAQGKSDKQLKKSATSILPSMQPSTSFPLGPSPQNGMTTAERQRETFYINKITNNYYQIGKNQKTPQKTITPNTQDGQ